MVAATPKLKTFCVLSLFFVLALLALCTNFPEAVAGKDLTRTPLVPFAIEGFHDGTNCDKIFGWAWDSATPNTPISVDIFDGRTKILTVLANEFRSDLTSKGNGFHAFNFTTPIALRTDKPTALLLEASAAIPDQLFVIDACNSQEIRHSSSLIKTFDLTPRESKLRK
jgi:hypothetical protein